MPPPRNVRRSGYTWLRSARDETCAIVSNSERPFGSCSDSRRSDCGMSTRRSFMERTPRVSSIADRSSGEWTRYGKLVRRSLGHFLVRGFIEQVGRKVPSQLELQDPAVTVRIGVDELGFGCQLFVDLADLPRDRRVEVARRLDRLDDAECLARRELAARARQFQKDHVAHLPLREIRYADGGVLAADRDPLLRLCLATLSHGDSPSSR